MKLKLAREPAIPPEVVHELFELVAASGQGHHDVDGDAGGVHPLAPDLHQRPERAEEDQAAELFAGLPPEDQLVHGALVLLRPADTWRYQRPSVNDRTQAGI